MPCLLTWWKQLHCKNFLPPSQPACPRPVFYRIKYRLEKEIFRKWLVRIWGAITMEMGNEQTWERNPRKGEDTLDVKNVNVATDARIMEKHWENLNSYATARTDLVKLHLLLLHLQLTSSLLRMSQFLERKKIKKKSCFSKKPPPSEQRSPAPGGLLARKPYFSFSSERF